MVEQTISLKPKLIDNFPQFNTIEQAIEALRIGQFVVVVDDHRRENEGDLVCGAEFVTPKMVNFMATEARGLICLAMTGARLDHLQLPLMVNRNTDHHQTAFTVSIDASPDFGVTTGISAQDRARTIQLAIDPATVPNDLRRPGHIFPLRAQVGGVLKRAGHTEAAVDLARLAGLYPAGVICEIQNPNGSMARFPELSNYARKHSLPIISIKDLIHYRLKSDRFIQREAIAQLPTQFGNFEIYGYRNILDGSEVTAIVKGNPQKLAHQPTLVRIHSQCFTGDVLGSLHCDCHQKLHTALKLIETIEQGVIVYLKEDSKEMSLVDKLNVHPLQD